ncbi:MAG TPA: MBL fold metallo-hydrolase [Steroidobacteraceae bacterium]|jgi:glyoxylase-like metal-dependent hydrolase (beta-lactamase superfamily II)|nr:MBL fold metallo-hydrolase [Steroidobacteraceae bacterium]
MLTALLLAACYGAAAAAAEPMAGVDVVPVRPGIDMVMVHGQNVAVQFGPDGAVVVDTGAPGDSAALLSAIKQVTSEPIRFIINTSASPDRVGGNAEVSVAGQGFGEGEVGFGGGRFVGASNAPIIAQANVLLAMTTTAGAAYSSKAMPTLTYDAGGKGFSLNGDSIEIMHIPDAHSDGDSVVMFRRADVLVSGDIVDMQHFPQIDLAHGGSINGEVAALNQLVDLTVPALPLYWHGGGSVVIPARGRLMQQEEIVQYRDMLTILRDRVQALINQHRSLAQVHAADPTAGYDGRYGAEGGPWSTDQFVAAVYQSLTAAQAHGRGR